jgi:hypothetical protein
MMLDFLLADANTWYAIAFGIVVVLGIVEGLGLLLGVSFAALLDNISPIELDYEVDFEADVSSSGLTQVLGWLCLNRLPLMVWLVVFLVSFAISGYALNYLTHSILQSYLPSFVALPMTLVFGLFLTKVVGQRIAHIMPKNESSAIGQDTFAGHVAQITLGTAKVGSPAEASFTDKFKQKHYLMVEPLESDQEFAQGHKVVLVQKGPHCWQVTSFQ